MSASGLPAAVAGPPSTMSCFVHQAEPEVSVLCTWGSTEPVRLLLSFNKPLFRTDMGAKFPLQGEL